MADQIATFAQNRALFKEIIGNEVEHPYIRRRLTRIASQYERGESSREMELSRLCTSHDMGLVSREDAESLVTRLNSELLRGMPNYYRFEKHGPVIFEGECDVETFKNSTIKYEDCYGGFEFVCEHACISIVIREDAWWEDIQEMKRLLIDGELDNVLKKEPLQ